MIIAEELRSIDMSVKKIRNFGFLWAGIFIAIGVFVDRASLFAWAGAAALLLVLGFFYSWILRLPYKAWMSISIVIGFFVSRIILITFFLVVMIPIGLVGRLFGKRFLDRASDSPDSYWVVRTEPTTDQKDLYKRQF